MEKTRKAARFAKNHSLALFLATLLVLPPFGQAPAAQATATSLEYIATSYNGSGSWAPSTGTGNATVLGTPATGSSFGIKVDGSYPIRAPHNAITNLSTTDPRTIQIWANVSRLPTSGTDELFTKYGTGWDGYYLRVLPNGAVRLITNGNLEIITTSNAGVVTAGQWHLITMVAQIGGVRKVYVDNTLVINTPSGADTTYSNTGTVWIGGYLGCVGGFRAHQGELTTAQIAAARDYFGSTTITGVCPATVTVTYNGNNNTSGTAPASSSATTDTSFAVASAGALARTGYTFAGWNSKADGTGTDFPAGTSVTWNTGIDTTLYAKWTPNTLAVTYDANGGTTTSSGDASTTTGATMTSLPTAVRPGHTFNGWFTSSSGGTRVTTSAGHGRTSDFTLFAQWTAATFTVTYVYNGADAGNSTISASYSANDPALTLPTPTRSGYTFDGWYSDSGFSTLMGSAGASYSPTSTVTAYAKWIANSFAITYDTQGGGPIPDGSTLTNGSIVASPGSPTREGFTFAGWFIAPSGGSAITFPYTHNRLAAFTLYAQWTPVASSSAAPSADVPPPVTTAEPPQSATVTTTTTPLNSPVPAEPLQTVLAGTAPAPLSSRRQTSSSPRRPSTTTTTAPRRALAPLLTIPSTVPTTAPAATKATDSTSPKPSTPVVSVIAPISDLSQPVLSGDRLPDADPENPIVIHTGPDTAWNVITINQRVVQMRDAGNFRLSVTALTQAGEMAEVNARGAITLRHGDYITVSGEGYQAGTEVVTWLFSKPRRLGALSVDSKGTFQSKLRVSSSVEFGEHTVQVNGFTSSGELRSLNLAVEVVGTPQLQSVKSGTTEKSATSPQWWTIGPILSLVVISASSMWWMIFRRRRRASENRG